MQSISHPFYLMGTNGVLWALAGIVVVIDLIFLCLSIIPGLEARKRKGEMIRNFAGNRVMFLLNTCSLGFFGIVTTLFYCLALNMLLSHYRRM